MRDVQDRLWVSMLEVFEVVERLFAVEQLDVSRLRRRQSPHRPAQMHEVRLDWRVHRVHADLARKAIGLSRVARAARGDDVRPVIRTAAGERDEMVARQRLAWLELDL